MRFLVTGAQGFLGGEIVKQLQLRDSDVVAAGRRTAAGIYCCELTDLAEVQAMVDRACPDRIIHCAAHMPQSQAEYKNINDANKSLRMLENLLATSGCPLIHISSMTVYGSSLGRPVLEEDGGTPQNAYGEGKWQAELLLQTHNHPTLAVRIPGLFGPARQSGLIYNVIHRLKYGTSGPNLPDSPVLWAAMHVSDAATGVIQLAQATINSHQAINMGYRGKFSIDQFLATATRLFDRKISYKLHHPEFEFDLTQADAMGAVSDKTFKDALIQFSKEI